MAFASIRDSMMMIPGSRQHQDRGNANVAGESSTPADNRGHGETNKRAP
jgi:hypothetical protein